jgi:outer membrane lipoprotein-sorting protein
VINPFIFGIIIAVVALTSIASTGNPTTVSAQNMTGNMTSGQDTTADMNQTGSISSLSGGILAGDVLPRH